MCGQAKTILFHVYTVLFLTGRQVSAPLAMGSTHSFPKNTTSGVLKTCMLEIFGFFLGGGSIEFLPLFGRFIVLSLILLSHDEFVKNITNLPKFIPFVIYFPFGRTKYNLWIFIKLAKNLVIDICEFTNSK